MRRKKLCKKYFLAVYDHFYKDPRPLKNYFLFMLMDLF